MDGVIRPENRLPILESEQEDLHMSPRVASIFDQNPARIRHIARRKQKKNPPVLQAFIGIQLLVGLVAVYFWNFLPI
jgi:hypothetical protein